MTALGKLFRTTTFKLTLVYLTVFALFAAFLLAYFAWNTRRLVTQQIVATVDAEISGPLRPLSAGRHPPADLRHRRPRQPAGLEPLSPHHRGRRGRHRQYRLADHRHARQVAAGPRPPIAASTTATPPPSTRRWCACCSLPGGFRLLVGRDLAGARAAARHHHRRRPLVDRARGRARHRRRLLRHAPRAQARRRHDRHHPDGS